MQIRIYFLLCLYQALKATCMYYSSKKKKNCKWESVTLWELCWAAFYCLGLSIFQKMYNKKWSRTSAIKHFIFKYKHTIEYRGVIRHLQVKQYLSAKQDKNFCIVYFLLDWNCRQSELVKILCKCAQKLSTNISSVGSFRE